MARITYVKKAQQRYAMVPVLDENGKQKVTPVLGRNGEQKTTKSGKPVVMKVTVADKTQPLPNRKCDKCSKEIGVGDPYKHVTPKSGPYGGHTRYRCAECPPWEVWELSNSLSARIAQILDGYSISVDSDSDAEDIRGQLESLAGEIRDLAEEKRESAQNIEDGFGHPTSMSDELNDVADQLESWADDVEGADIEDKPEEVEDPGDDPDRKDFDTEDEYDEAFEEWQEQDEAYRNRDADLESWFESVQSEVDSALGGSPF